MSALVDGTAEARMQARRTLHEKARTLMESQGLDLRQALLKVWLDPNHAELVKLAREPKPLRKSRPSPEELAERIRELKAQVDALAAAQKKRARRKL